MRKLINIAGWILIITGLFVLLGFVEARHRNITCCQFNVYVDYRDADPLLDADELKSWIINAVDSIQGKPIEMIDTDGIKDMMLKNPYVKSANAYTTIEGDFNVKIRQREPVLRIIDQHNRSFYLDMDGVLFPTTRGFSSRVRVANGHIQDKKVETGSLPMDVDTLPSSSIYRKLLMMVRFMDDHEFMSVLIDQIYVTHDEEFELVPKLGDHIIIFGDTEDMHEKFNKLEAFYLDGIKQAGWDKYDKINLKFKHQIVCSKR